jgi:hypothetical protein
MAPLLSLSLERAKIDYERDGFARIPAVFTEEEVGHIRAVAQATAKKHPERASWVKNQAALLHWPQKLSPLLAQYSEDPRLAQIVNFFLGDKVRQLINQIHLRGPYSSEEYGWHQDVIFRTPATDFKDLEHGFLQTVIVVDPMDEGNAPLEFVPGSHKAGNMKLYRSDSDPRLNQFVRDRVGIKMVACPGDILIWHILTVHGSDANRSNRPRMTYLNGFAADAVVTVKERYPLWRPDAD